MKNLAPVISPISSPHLKRTLALTGFLMVIAVITSSPVLSAGELKVPDTTKISAYAESAFPVPERTTVKARLTQRLQQVKSAARWTDVKIEQTYGVLPADNLFKFRAAKRQEVRNHLFTFIESNLKRGDATGLGFAEQGLADADVMDKILNQDLVNWGNFPRRESVSSFGDWFHWFDSSCQGNNPVILNVKDFGAKGDGKGDDRPAFDRACDAIRALGGRPAILRIPAGTYRMATARPEETRTDSLGEWLGNPAIRRTNCAFSNLQNCLIEGDGPEKTHIVGAVYNASIVDLILCRNVTLKGIEASLERTPFMEGKVLAFDSQTGACDLELKPDSLTPDDRCWIPNTKNNEEYFESFGYLYDPQGRLDLTARLLPWQLDRSPKPSNRFEKLPGERRWRIVFNRVLYRNIYDKFVKNIKVGYTAAFPNRCNFYSGVAMRGCFGCTFEDVWLRNSRGGGFVTWRTRMATLWRCRLFPKEGHFLSSNADASFFDPGPVLYQCHFESMGDDGFNALRKGVFSEKWPGGPCWAVRPDRGNNLGGDLITFADFHTGQYLANRFLAQNDEQICFNAKRWRRLSRFTKPLPDACFGALLYEPRQLGIGTVICGCTFRNGRWAGNVIQTPNALLENNCYETLHEGVRLGALGDWKEGPPPYNVVVRNCEFENCNYGFNAYLRMFDKAAFAKGKQRFGVVPCAPIRNVEVYDNMFKAIRRIGVKVQHTGDSSFYRNQFIQTPKEYDFSTCEGISCR